MPPVADWSVPFTLTSPYGTLVLNTAIPGLGIYFLNPQSCQMSLDVRATKSNVPQSDGSILHRRFMTGMEGQLAIQLWNNADAVACDEQLQEMQDLLTKHLRALLNAGDNEGRLSWSPAGGNQRMLDDIRLLVYPLATLIDSNAGTELSCTIDSEFPYAQDENQTTTSINDGGSSALVNDGSAEYFPVFKVYAPNPGPMTAFTLTNAASALQIVYDSTLPGADTVAFGDYIEINTFRNTAYLNGNGADMKAGIDELSSEYWPLLVGSNSVSITGGNLQVLWAPAWG